MEPALGAPSSQAAEVSSGSAQDADEQLVAWANAAAEQLEVDHPTPLLRRGATAPPGAQTPSRQTPRRHAV